MLNLTKCKGAIRKVGLTGSIGSGKSTAAGFFRSLGVETIDADELARAVVEPGREAHREIGEVFGEEVFGPGGQLDRAALAEKVFGDQQARRTLEEIIHPRVAALAGELMRSALDGDPGGFVVYDVPLLFETGMEGDFDLVVTVLADEQLQRRRLAGRAGMSPEEVQRRVAAQMDAGRKAGLADVVLDNRGKTDLLNEQVEALVAAIRAHNSKKG